MTVASQGVALQRVEGAVGALQVAVNTLDTVLAVVVGAVTSHEVTLLEQKTVLQQVAGAVVTHEVILQEVARAVVTQKVAQRVQLCAPSTALLLSTCIPGSDCKQCSAVPLHAYAAAAPNSSSEFFLASAHCFPLHWVAGSWCVQGAAINLYFDRVLRPCRLVAHFNTTAHSKDLALLRCQAMPVGSTTLSVQPYALHAPAVLLGFSLGEHVVPDLSTFALSPNGKISTVSPHIRFARLSLSFQTPDSETSPQSSSQKLLFNTSLPSHASSRGFVDITPEQGMSGGAVVDLDCGLIGIIEGRSYGVGGVFVRMTEEVRSMVMTAVDKELATPHGSSCPGNAAALDTLATPLAQAAD